MAMPVCIWRVTCLAVLPDVLLILATRVADERESCLAAGRTAVFSRQQAGHHALNQSRIDKLCTEDVASEACVALGVPKGSDAKATAAQLAVIVMSSEAEAVTLLSAIGLDGGAPFSCMAFCKAMAENIPTIMGLAAPTQAGLGCLDEDCHAETDVSTEKLALEGLHLEPFDHHSHETRPGNGTVLELDPRARGRMLYRTALNVILGIFPSPGEQDDDEAEEQVDLVQSLLQNTSNAGMIGPRMMQRRMIGPGMTPGGMGGRPAAQFGRQGGGQAVQFGPATKQDNHQKYREYMVKAASWISIALRKLPSNGDLIRKWYGGGQDVSRQTAETRSVLTRMLQLTGMVYIERGGPCCDIGTFACVGGYASCFPWSNRDCGEKTNGRYKIYICDLYWWFPLGDSGRVAGLVHEASHHFGMKDEMYCQPALSCLMLSAARARKNADTITMFVRDSIK